MSFGNMLSAVDVSASGSPGIDIRGGLFRGVEIDVESLRSLVAGGIAFATPNDPKARQARNGTSFFLYDQPEKDWLEWAPRISIPPDESSQKHGRKKKGPQSPEAASKPAQEK